MSCRVTIYNKTSDGLIDVGGVPAHVAADIAVIVIVDSPISSTTGEVCQAFRLLVTVLLTIDTLLMAIRCHCFNFYYHGILYVHLIIRNISSRFEQYRNFLPAPKALYLRMFNETYTGLCNDDDTFQLDDDFGSLSI